MQALPCEWRHLGISEKSIPLLGFRSYGPAGEEGPLYSAESGALCKVNELGAEVGGGGSQ